LLWDRDELSGVGGVNFDMVVAGLVVSDVRIIEGQAVPAALGVGEIVIIEQAC
jgi:hypothetical protein